MPEINIEYSVNKIAIHNPIHSSYHTNVILFNCTTTGTKLIHSNFYIAQITIQYLRHNIIVIHEPNLTATNILQHY